MAKRAIKIPTVLSMTSFEVSELVQSRHDVVKKSIERLADRGVITLPPMTETSFKDKIGKNQKRSVYRFDGEKGKRDCIVVVAQLSPEFTAAVVDRWQHLEKELSSLKVRLEEREDSKQLFRHMTDVIKDVRETEGKETKFWHYSNEANMLNKIIFGKTTKQFREFHNLAPDAPIRDMMTKLELEAVNRLQNINENLYSCGFDFELRKAKLQEIFDRDFNQRLIDETLAIEA